MDGPSFDKLARLAASGASRRGVLKSAIASALAIAGSGTASVLGAEEAGAARRCKRAGALCTSTRQCCPRETKRLCRVQRNAGNSDTTCCGGAGATCGGKNGDGDDRAQFCCVGFECRGQTCRKA